MSDQYELSPESKELLNHAQLYERLSLPRLVSGFYIPGRLYDMQIYVMLLRRCGLPLPVSREDWQQKSRALQLTDYEELYERCRNADLVWFGMVVKIQLGLMQHELQKRFGERPVGLDILMGNWERIRQQWIQRRRVISSVSPEDTIQDGIERGLNLLEEVKIHSLEEDDHRQFLNLPTPAFPFSGLMNEFDSRVWNWLVADMWRPSLEAAFKNVVPLVRGDMESAGQKVDNFLREQTRKMQRRKNKLDGKEKFPKPGPEGWRAEWDFSRAAGEDRRETIEHELHINRFPDKSNMVEVLRKAQKKWGKKGVVVLRAMFDGKTEEEAASEGLVTSKTARNYKLKLAKEFSSKK